MKKIMITKDGWTYLLDGKNVLGFGDINVDVEIIDLRGKKRFPKAELVKLKEEMKTLRSQGTTYAAIGKKYGVSRQRIFQIIK